MSVQRSVELKVTERVPWITYTNEHRFADITQHHNFAQPWWMKSEMNINSVETEREGAVKHMNKWTQVCLHDNCSDITVCLLHSHGCTSACIALIIQLSTCVIKKKGSTWSFRLVLVVTNSVHKDEIQIQGWKLMQRLKKAQTIPLNNSMFWWMRL